MPHRSEQLAEDTRQQREALLPETWRLLHPVPESQLNVVDIPIKELSSEEQQYTGVADVQTLLEKLRTGEWSAYRVTKAFCHRATLAHDLTNCLTVPLFQRALKRARDLDAQFQQRGRPTGPLHGLPVSIKDQFDVDGVDSSLGMSSLTHKPATGDSPLVQMLQGAGAIVIAKTTLPQTGMLVETVSPLFGVTVNPINRSLSCGGSSGGEGPMVLLRGSAIGIGTDIGASVRYPASCQGLFGFKPSLHRLPFAKAVQNALGNEGVEFSPGPIGRTIDDCIHVFRALLDTEPWQLDPSVLRLPWRQHAFDLQGRGSQLCFGLMMDDGVVTPHPPILRALHLVAEALKYAGHEVVPWQPPVSHKEMGDLWTKLAYADGLSDWNRLTSGTQEPRHPYLARPAADPLPLPQYFELVNRRNELRQDYLRAWQSRLSARTARRCDALLMPVMPHPPPPHGKARYIAYTSFVNLLDLSACSFPVTTVDADLDQQADWPPSVFLSKADEMNAAMYTSAELFDGAPIGLQLIGQRQEDEEVLAMTKIVQDALKASRKSRL